MSACSDCKYYEPTSGSLILNAQKTGSCHRYPPQGFAIAGQMNGQVGFLFRHSEVQPTGWCGEWEPIKTGISIDIKREEEVSYSVPLIGEDY